jgi:hypothetical protein
MLGKVFVAALAAATIVGVSHARAFDGNDRILPVDRYSRLPANEPDDESAYFEPVRAYYAPLRSRRVPQVAGYRRARYEPESYPPAVSERYPRRDVVVPAPGAEFVREEVIEAPAKKLERSEDQPVVVARYSPRRDVTCQGRVSAGLKLPRAGVAWAKWSAKRAWRKEVSERFGPLYAGLAFARGERFDCDGGISASCEFSAVPCRPVS